jgi:hypothetical protein
MGICFVVVATDQFFETWMTEGSSAVRLRSDEPSSLLQVSISLSS